MLIAMERRKAYELRDADKDTHLGYVIANEDGKLEWAFTLNGLSEEEEAEIGLVIEAYENATNGKEVI